MISFFHKNLNKFNSKKYIKMLNIWKEHIKWNQVTLLQKFNKSITIRKKFITIKQLIVLNYALNQITKEKSIFESKLEMFRFVAWNMNGFLK